MKTALLIADILWVQLVAIHPIEWIAMFAGATGVWLSIKEHVSAWPLFILCYLGYIFIGFRSGYYAFGTMNLGFVGIAVYGWYEWSGAIATEKLNGNQSEITRISLRHWCFIITGISVFTVAIGILLAKTGEARLPYFDAFAVGNALTAQWLLTRKYIENWLFWIISDCVYISLFLKDRLWPSVILFGIFIILACKGWYEWNQSMLRKATSPET